jgi:hypothetical protein
MMDLFEWSLGTLAERSTAVCKSLTFFGGQSQHAKKPPNLSAQNNTQCVPTLDNKETFFDYISTEREAALDILLLLTHD